MTNDLVVYYVWFFFPIHNLLYIYTITKLDSSNIPHFIVGQAIISVSVWTVLTTSETILNSILVVLARKNENINIYTREHSKSGNRPSFQGFTHKSMGENRDEGLWNYLWPTGESKSMEILLILNTNLFFEISWQITHCFSIYLLNNKIIFKNISDND